MLIESKHTMVSWDGTELFYRNWRPSGGTAKRAVILFHRGHEHSARWQDVVEQMELPDIAYFAWDARGHGHSPGDRGYAEDFGTLVRDVDTFVRHVSETNGIAYKDIVILAHSVGSVLVSTWVHDYAPPVRALVLGSPALRVRLYVPFAVPGLRLLQRLKGKAFISSYVKGRLLTRDPAKQARYDTDPLITPRIAVNILLGLYDAGTRLLKDACALNLPVLVLSSGADFVVEQSAQRSFYDQLPHPRKEMQRFPGFLHDTFNERDNHLPIGKARLFIQDVFAREAETPDLLNADQDGFTKAEYEALKQPLPLWSLKGLGYTITGVLLKTAGRLSDGIALGWRTGFDSGSMLDYVYRNKASGITPLGRLMDRVYLDSPGWAGIRQRKIHLETLLQEAIGRVGAEGKRPHILDIAAGQGRYVLDVIKDQNRDAVSAELRDFSEINVEAGRERITALGLQSVTFEAGDAFDQDALAASAVRPDIAIVSGLYELFPENAQVRRSLAGLAEATEPGAYLIYTNQPWHPQLELIARVLRSHQGGAWVMRRRTQQEMDQLVSKAGFEKVKELIDNEGIFSVSLARRV